MRIVLNIGMHKTGTSAIQQSLKNYDQHGLRYLPGFHPNHSSVYATLFMDKPETYSAHRKNSRNTAEIKSLKARFEKTLAKAIANAKKHQVHTLLSSAEDVCNLDESAITQLRDWCDKTFSEVLMVGYVRPPTSFMSSALQQRIKGGVPINFGNIYPEYRQRFEKFDRVFGRERVKLVRFDRHSLYKGDVVLDFMHRVGVEFDTSYIVQENTSRSLETAATLYAQRKLGRGWLKYSGSPRDNNELSSALETLGNSPILLHPTLSRHIKKTHHEDLNWISKRLGADIFDAPRKLRGANYIRNEEDLLALSQGHLPQVLDLIKEKVGDQKVNPQIIANAVDLLLDVIRENNTDGTWVPDSHCHTSQKFGLSKVPL